MNNKEQVILVDQQDQAIGAADKLTVHQQGLLHRAFSVFIFRNNNTELLLQQRHKDKYHSSNLWTNTCCSHPRPNENIIAAAERRLTEEMGLHIKLTLVGNFTYTAEFNNGLIEHEFDHVLIGQYNNEPIIINPLEVANYEWLTIKKLLENIQTDEHSYTPWLAKALAIALTDKSHE